MDISKLEIFWHEVGIKFLRESGHKLLMASGLKVSEG